MTDFTPDTEWTLHAAGYALSVSPYGASLRGLTRNGHPVIAGYRGAAGKVGGQGDVLIPFPGRVNAGKYHFEGADYQMPLNDKESPNAIYGFLRTQMWEVSDRGESHVAFATSILPDQHPGYPFHLEVALRYALGEDGLTVTIQMRNAGETDAPVAAGCHPYFTAGTEWIDSSLLELPFSDYLEYEGFLPTGKTLPVHGSPFDFRNPKAIGSVHLNTCYLNPMPGENGWTAIRLSAPSDQGGRTVEVALDRAFSYVVLYSGDPLPDDHRRRALAIEPMTCGSDAFNHPAWGLITLMPGQTTRAEWKARLIL